MITFLFVYAIIYIYGCRKIILLSYCAIDDLGVVIQNKSDTLINEVYVDNHVKANLYKSLLRNMDETIDSIKKATLKNVLITQLWMCFVVLILSVMDEDGFAYEYVLQFKRSILEHLDTELEHLDQNITPLSVHIDLGQEDE
jgi:hypothetical protein